ncbi:MAG: phosphatidate cytidylyltransferase [Paracoccaceae bacterium]
MSRSGPSFPDLGARFFSAVFLVILGVGGIGVGGVAFLALLSLVAGLMLWELSRMAGGGAGVSAALGMLAAATTFLAGSPAGYPAVAPVFLAPVLGSVLLSGMRWIFLFYGGAIMAAVLGLFMLRDGGGLLVTLWLVAVVAAADIGGYFFGRILGGPKILPSISPKKTWSGTLGGWLLAAVVGALFALNPSIGSEWIILGVLAAVFSQAGDIVESAIKRRCGVKDSSRLIPGHGGFLDRFDALVGASLFMMLAGLLIGLPEMAGP